MSTKTRKSIRKLALGATALAAVSVVMADTHDAIAAVTIEEIVVTARQRAESLTDVPASITAITKGDIEAAGVQRAEDFINLTPGVSFVDTAEVGDAQVNIRGINSTRDAQASFALIVDGILKTNPAALNRDYTNLEQIEVLKGPHGALYGRNAAAGAVIITTAEPGDEFEGSLTASYGNNQSFYAAGTVSGPISDNAGFVLGADWRKTDGFYRNRFLDRKVVDNYEGFNINGRLVADIDDKSSIDVKVLYGEVDAASISFNAAFQLPGFAAFLGNPDFFMDVNEHAFSFDGNIVPGNNQETFEVSAKYERDLDFATLSFWGQYSDIKNDLIADGTSAAFGFFNGVQDCQDSVADLFNSGYQLPSPLFVLGPVPEATLLGAYSPAACDGYQFQERNQSDISFEVRLTSPGDQDLRWIVGAYYLSIDRQVGVAQLVEEGPVIESLINVNTEQLVYDDFDSTVYAGFGSIAYDVTEDMELSVAVRYDREEAEVESLVPADANARFIIVDGDPALPNPVNPAFVPALNPSGLTADERTFEQFQPKISLSYAATEEVNLFASWGVGFKSGGFNNLGSAATLDLFLGPIGTELTVFDQFEKEKSSAFEAGFKGRFMDGRVSVDGAVYYTKIDDMQFFEFFAGPWGLLRVVNNIDESEVKGVEVAASAVLTDFLKVYGGVNFMDTEIKENAARPSTVGNKVPYAPDYTINVGAEIDYPINDDYSFMARADWALTGKTWFHTLQGQENPTLFGVPGDYSVTQRDAYDVFNLRAGIQTEMFSVIGYAKNLFGTDYLEEVLTAPEFGGSFIHPGDERSFGVEVTVNF